MNNPSHQHVLYGHRRAGLLLHPTSLPGPYAKGIVGHDAYRFVDFLAASGISVWQMLPLGPTHSDDSPYQSLSAHACDSTLISLDWLKDRHLLDRRDAPYTFAQHEQHLQQAWQQFSTKKPAPWYEKFEAFKESNDSWLDDYSLFMAIRDNLQSQPWMQWEPALRDRNKSALATARKKLQESISFHKFKQYLIFTQWGELKQYANEQGILLFGDMPIYVSHDSADVWAQRSLFTLDDEGKAEYVAGVPPDYFSATGQRWGNPQYHWDTMQKDDFKWWQDRLKTQLDLFDVVRVDHFRGFRAYWEIEADCETAIDGRWVNAPGESLLGTLYESFHNLPLVAEDLGLITDDVHELRNEFSLPGMKVLHFAFDGNPQNLYLPHNHEFKAVVYTGTHDNDTTLSWYEDLDKETRRYLQHYLNYDPAEKMPWPLIRAAMASVCCLAVVPMQDILELGKGHRMNTPGTSSGNWHWRFSWEQVANELTTRLSDMLNLYDRKVN